MQIIVKHFRLNSIERPVMWLNDHTFSIMGTLSILTTPVYAHCPIGGLTQTSVEMHKFLAMISTASIRFSGRLVISHVNWHALCLIWTMFAYRRDAKNLE
jgi:hypothetical protein